MRTPKLILAILALSMALPAAAVQEVGEHGAGDLEVKIWLDESNGEVLRPGEHLDVHFQVNEACYVVVYDVDTEGFLNLLYPRYGESAWTVGRRIHRIPGSDEDYDLVVDGPKGIEYLVAVASPYPLDMRSLYDEEVEDDEIYLYSGRITGDPSEAIFEVNERLAWGAEDYSPEGYASDIAWFYVGRKVPYPRYLVYNWYPERYWDPWWDPYVHVDIWLDFSWGNDWCHPRWWCHGCRPSVHYWYVDRHTGQRLRWKTNYYAHHNDDPYKPYAHRVKHSRWTKEGRPSRYSSKAKEPVRVKDTRTVWKNGWTKTRDGDRDKDRTTRKAKTREKRDTGDRDRVREKKQEKTDTRSSSDRRRETVKNEKKKAEKKSDSRKTRKIERKPAPKKDSGKKASDGKKKSDSKPSSGKKR